MKLKLTSHEAFALCQSIVAGADKIRFITEYESKLSGAILKNVVQKISSKHYEADKKASFKLAKEEVLALNYILPQLSSEDPYSSAVLSELTQKINVQCLSI